MTERLPLHDATKAGVIDGKKFAVLLQKKRVVAVYRLRTDDKLRRLRRWPSESDIAALIQGDSRKTTGSTKALKTVEDPFAS